MKNRSFLALSLLLLAPHIACAQEQAAVIAAPTLPEAPLGVAMSANSPSSITLSWYRAPKNDASGYVVYWSAQKEGPFERLLATEERSATHEKLAPGATYFYQVAATNAQGEGPKSAPAQGFTFAPSAPTPFPAKIAKNMCISLGAEVVSDTPPIASKLAALTDGSDATTCRLRKASEVRIRLSDSASWADSPYLMLHFRTHGTVADWSNDPFARAPKNYTILESLDSSDGKNGTWTELKTGVNELLDSVILLPNHKPKWLALRCVGPEIPKSDTRPMPSDLMLSRLDIFRAAPKGFRNDFWIFAGDSLVVQDMPAGGVAGREAFFSDLVRQKHPDRYPIVVHAGRGGEIMANTLARVKNFLPVVSAPNGTDTPTATILCFEPGFNDVGLMAGVWSGQKFQKMLAQTQEMCQQNGLFLVPVRVQFATPYLNLETLEPAKANIFHNTLVVNLAGVDMFARAHTPYAVDAKTGLPLADYWNYTRENWQVALAKDGVHHTKSGVNGINRLWAEVAEKMIYSPQS